VLTARSCWPPQVGGGTHRLVAPLGRWRSSGPGGGRLRSEIQQGLRKPRSTCSTMTPSSACGGQPFAPYDAALYHETLQIDSPEGNRDQTRQRPRCPGTVRSGRRRAWRTCWTLDRPPPGTADHAALVSACYDCFYLAEVERADPRQAR